MSLTRKMLKAMGIEDDKIEQIIDAHTEVTDALKTERDNYKADAEKLAEVQKKLDEADKKITESEDFKKQLEELRGEISAKETAERKTKAFEKALKGENFSESSTKMIIKHGKNYIDKIELDDNDEIKNVGDIIPSVKSEWADFVPKETITYTTPDTPPKNTNTSGTKPEIAQYAADYYNRLYGAKKED